MITQIREREKKQQHKLGRNCLPGGGGWHTAASVFSVHLNKKKKAATVNC